MTPLHIFKPGVFTANSGQTLEFTADDLTAVATGYQTERHEAPLVVGHPAIDAPAYGWVERVTFSEYGLFAHPKEVDSEFAEWVNAGKYKKISAAFYTPSAPSNPNPGHYYLRHVGFLGAAAPAVKGLRQPTFAGDDDGIVTLEFSAKEEWAFAGLASILRNLREWFLEKNGKEVADRLIPEYEISGVQNASLDTPESAFAETETVMEQPDLTTENTTDIAEREAALKAEMAAFAEQKAAIAKREAALKAIEIETAKKSALEFAETQVKSGKILPRQAAGLAALMLALPVASIEFADGDKTVSANAADWLKSFVAELPVQVTYGEVAKGAVETATGNLPIEDRCKLEWNQSPDLRAEFADSVDSYIAFVRAESAGQVKILNKGKE